MVPRGGHLRRREDARLGLAADPRHALHPRDLRHAHARQGPPREPLPHRDLRQRAPQHVHPLQGDVHGGLGGHRPRVHGRGELELGLLHPLHLRDDLRHHARRRGRDRAEHARPRGPPQPRARVREGEGEGGRAEQDLRGLRAVGHRRERRAHQAGVHAGPGEAERDPAHARGQHRRAPGREPLRHPRLRRVREPRLFGVHRRRHVGARPGEGQGGPRGPVRHVEGGGALLREVQRLRRGRGQGLRQPPELAPAAAAGREGSHCG
mmetsp:Transcript_25060/g.70650  ORF Transcript_25060/g.70650 Transcript_25060/m.70650 type:complete len:265 (-) Transcript_25060:282-1076(-)